PDLDEKRLREAYEFARDAHKGQKRMDGSSYVLHPLAAAMILTELHVDEDTLVACLLHDVPEDTEYTTENLENLFGKKVAFLVDGVTKLSKVKYRHDMMERQVESLKKFFLHSARDLRIILIKLADRLHNMRTLEFVREEKQLRIARETMEIYVAIADLLGIWEFKSVLEDLCFQYIYPKEYADLKKQISRSSDHQRKLLKQTVQIVKNSLKQHSIPAEVEARPKTLYSIFRKMVSSGQRLEDLNDLLALRIIIDDKEMCYRVLGIIHALFRPRSGRIKDFIAVPKPNGYQSLHTTVFGVEGVPTEFQIRTHDMHFEAQYGIAAHYFYKQSRLHESQLKRAKKGQSAWVQKVLQLQKDLKNNYDFLENLKIDIFQDRIFVFTPQGDVIDLPQGSNGIDFGYHIHSDVGNRAVGMYRNGLKLPLSTTLKTGDTVRIITSKSQKYPRRDWLEKITTNLAKSKIQTALKKQTASKRYRAGHDFLKKELHRYGCGELDNLTEKQKNKLVKTFDSKTWKDFLGKIGDGTVTEEQFIKALYTSTQLLGKPCRGKGTPLTHYSKSRSRLVEKTNEEDSGTPYYRVKISILAVDRVGFLRDIGMQLANLGANIYQIKVSSERHGKDGYAHVIITLEVMNFEQLQKAFDAIEAVEGVEETYRVPEKKSKTVASS
ncbi:bifunctional (p)ppGpp synthetase/guanosine-3',5'-bis(diphosphate) 3'-pyrophosphohydrolase, partial [Candidatus Peregrinibacteria bacterium]|nr:bifunctional (p)ppGpp synthetase/guanosine-3',5'-bis(diphosphate) 3'-pyrophosphohydrolase [Candidatus Peregrinibacteria bacterium]